MELTDRKFWSDYWENKKNVIQKIEKQSAFSALFSKHITSNHINTALELGGFPGYISIALHKYYNVKQADLLDYFIHHQIIKDLCELNKVDQKHIKTIEGDLFAEYENEKYDLVHSHGLIEHFEDTQQIINEHLKYLSNEGQLLITLPNFKGINGWFQKHFDKSNYEKHFIPCMEIKHLTIACNALALKNITVNYYGSFSMWLENMESKSKSFKLLFKLIWFVFKSFNKIVPLRNKIFSPYLYISAVKKNH